MTFTNILLGMFGGSVFFRTIKNWAADNKIKRQGFMITSDPRSIIERIISFIKENFYHIVPVYNILHSLRIFISNDEEYKNYIGPAKDYEEAMSLYQYIKWCYRKL